MIKSKKDLKKYLLIEKKNYNPTFFGQILSIFGASEKNIIWKYQKSLRLWEYHFNNGHKFLTAFFRLKTTKIGYKYGFSISPNIFEEGLKISHLGQVLINSNSRIGKNCLINIGCAIVSTGGRDVAAKIGDNCKIGVGAILIGDVCLGNNITIGAGAVVTKSFCENGITLAGVPARDITKIIK